MRLKWLVLAFAFLFFSAPAVPQSISPITIRFSHVVAPDAPKGRGAVRFKELAERYTDGRVKVEVFANSQLYKDNEEIPRQTKVVTETKADEVDFSDTVVDKK